MYRMLTIFMFCLAATWSVSAQTAPVPDKYEIETAADCARYNDDVLRCAEWLRTTPYDPTKSGEWLRVAGFLTRWSAGTDEVMYEISEETAPVLGADLGVEKIGLPGRRCGICARRRQRKGCCGRSASRRRCRDRGVSCQSRYVG